VDGEQAARDQLHAPDSVTSTMYLTDRLCLIPEAKAVEVFSPREQTVEYLYEVDASSEASRFNTILFVTNDQDSILFCGTPSSIHWVKRARAI